MQPTIEITTVRQWLEPLRERIIDVIACDNIDPCPLCEREPHDGYCGFTFAAQALAELYLLDRNLKNLLPAEDLKCTPTQTDNSL